MYASPPQYSHALQVDLWPSKWCPSHVWRGLPCANFGLPRSLCSRVIHVVRNRQTDVRQRDVRKSIA